MTRSLGLWGVRSGWLEGLLTSLTVLLLALSRFALLPQAPWEWDETLFARGIYDFNLAAHFPHPPGFPGWLALGHLLLPLAGTPYRALQLASAALSVAAVWPLSHLGRRVAPPAVATAAALLVLLAPGPWLHAVRGFSSTAAACLALGAAALAVAGLEGRRATWFTLLVAAAFLVRPVLLPPLAVLWLAGAATVRPWRRLLPGVGLAILAGLLALAAMAAAEGGWVAFRAALTTHGTRHFSRLVDNPGGWPELGLVKGLGGGAAALMVLVPAAAGLAVWRRRAGRRSAAAWAAVLGVLVLQLLLLQNRTYSRYAVPAQLALAPLVAGTAAAAAPPALAVAGVLGLAAAQAALALEPVMEQAAGVLPGWCAVERAHGIARRHAMAVVVEPELHPFASYLWHREGGGREAAEPPLVLGPWAPEPWQGVARPWVVATDHRDRYLEPLLGGELDCGGVSAELLPLTQARFLSAWVLVNPPLPLAGWWPREHSPDGAPFLWGRPGAELLLPPLPPGTWVELDVDPADGPDPLVVSAAGEVVGRLPGEVGRTRGWIGPELVAGGGPTAVRFDRARPVVPGGGDERPLAVQLFGARAVGPSVPWGGPAATPAQRERLRVEVDGSWPAERFAGVSGAWLRPRATLDLPAGEGELTLLLWAPRPTSPHLEVRLDGEVLARPSLVATPEAVTVRVPPRPEGAAGVRLELVARPFVPAAAGLGGDERELGVVLGAVRFAPPPARRWPWAW